jgi:hypothetical protein
MTAVLYQPSRKTSMMFAPTRIVNSPLWRLFSCFTAPLAFSITLSMLYPSLSFEWFLIAIGMILLSNLIWEVCRDWQGLYDQAMDVADESIQQMPPHGKGFVTLTMRRDLPPRLLWCVIVHDHSSRVYMGWYWWKQADPTRLEAVKPGVRRKQVA